MKLNNIIIAGFAFVLGVMTMSSSCEEDAEKVAEMNGGIKATVTTDYVNDGCEVLLEAKVDGEDKLFMPIELADEFKVDGKIVMMKYTVSRIQQTDCLKGQPIVIDEIIAVN